ncbi:MAG: hypothetical protein AAB455_03475 [Patescibacteria group bacterium]
MSDTKTLKDIRQSADVKDIRDKKTSKLTSAVYLVTNFLSDHDPIKWKLREKSLELLLLSSKTSVVGEQILSYIDDLIRLLEVALHDRQSSPMNLNLLRSEYASLKQFFRSQDQLLLESSFSSLPQTQTDPEASRANQVNQNRPTGPKIHRIGRPPAEKGLASKSDRQAIILNVLKTDLGLSIKDVAKSLPAFSSKTVQRELNLMVDSGLVKKVGERRWSRYSKI